MTNNVTSIKVHFSANIGDGINLNGSLTFDDFEEKIDFDAIEKAVKQDIIDKNMSGDINA